MKIKKGDNVKVLTGKDKGKSGTVESVLIKLNKVVVGGINIVKKHTKGKKKGEKGTIVEVASPIHASNVQKI